jgi:hypothetical protein
VDQATSDVEREAEQPQHQQDNSDCPKH